MSSRLDLNATRGGRGQAQRVTGHGVLHTLQHTPPGFMLTHKAGIVYEGTMGSEKL